jgi:hypothetical protein
VSSHLLSDVVTSVRASRQVAPPSAFPLTRCDLRRADVTLFLLYIEKEGIGGLNEPIRGRSIKKNRINNISFSRTCKHNLGRPVHVLQGTWASILNEFRGWGMSNGYAKEGTHFSCEQLALAMQGRTLSIDPGTNCLLRLSSCPSRKLTAL